MNWSYIFEQVLVCVCPFKYLLLSVYHILKWHKIDLEKPKRVVELLNQITKADICWISSWPGFPVSQFKLSASRHRLEFVVGELV